MRGFLLGLVAGAVVAAGILLAVMRPPPKDHRSYGSDIERSAWPRIPNHWRAHTLPLNNPDVVHAAQADHMNRNDVVIGVIVEDKARAYPWWIMTNFHVVNDVIGETPVYVSLCEVCSGAAAFVPIVDELPDVWLSFQLTGIRHGTFEVSDNQTSSRWHPFTGIAREGPLAGSRLQKLPLFLEHWERWKTLYPGTDVVRASARMRGRKHGRLTGKKIGDDFLPPLFGETANLSDERLPRHALVYGLIGRESGLAIPLAQLEEGVVLETSIEDVPVFVVRRGDFRVHAFERRHDGRELRLEAISRDPLRLRDQTGAVWDEWGRGVEGPDAGAKLPPARGYLTEWYEWVSSFPDSEIYAPGRG